MSAYTEAEAIWTNYAEARPPEVGVYEWRMPSVAIPGLMVRAIAWNRKRSAGYAEAVSPSFDHWNGYRVTVPAQLQWRETNKPEGFKSHDTIVSAEVEDICRCPHCKRPPKLHSCIAAAGGGVAISRDPHRMNSWWLKCCQWSHSPSLKDPRELIGLWNAALSPLAGSAP